MKNSMSSFNFSFSLASISACGVVLLLQFSISSSLIAAAQIAPQALLQPSGSNEEITSGVLPSIPDAKEDSEYSEGTRAIHESRWVDAESSFDKVVRRHGEHSEGALYWKAYAQNKQGHGDAALKTCGELRQGYPASRWVDECSALEIEIRGVPDGTLNGSAENSGTEGDNAQLHAIDVLLDKDQPHALAEIQSILNGDQTEAFKERALFLLVESNSPQAQKMLVDAANSDSNPALRARARQIIATIQGRMASALASAQVPHRLGVDVVVTDRAGQPVSGLTAQDFTLLDNNQPRSLAAFQAVTPGKLGDVSAPVAILIDAVNASISTVSYERSQISELLRRNGGKLDRPVTVLLFNGKGLQNIGGPSKDGNLLATAIDKADVTLHPFRRAQGFYGDVDRIQASLNMVAGVAKQHLNRPGREMLIWISPGWPLLPYSNLAPDNQQLQSIFNQIVALSTDLRLAHISIYSLYPNAPGAVDLEWDRYKEYLKGVPSRDKAQIGNLALQVLATQSGGRVLNYTDKYLGSEVADCLAEADEPYYSIHFDPPPAGHKDEFHSLKITVNRSGLTVRTNHGYYNEP